MTFIIKRAKDVCQYLQYANKRHVSLAWQCFTTELKITFEKGYRLRHTEYTEGLDTLLDGFAHTK